MEDSLPCRSDGDTPRRFAVVQEYGDRADGRIAAWGLASDDGATVFSEDGSSVAHLRSAESALRLYARGEHISSRLVWVDAE